jgi:formylglycine-generating enzyme required for sulfatase activity
MRKASPTRFVWFWPALFALVLFIGSITANLAPFPEEFKQHYGGWLWGFTALAGLITVGLAIWENRSRPADPTTNPFVAASAVDEQRQRYLKRLVHDLGHLGMMRAIDPRSASAESSGDALMPLADVYIALDTTARAPKPISDPQSNADDPFSGHDDKPLSALAALIANPRLVLLGNPGSGKSTFVNHLALCLANEGLQPKADWLARLDGWPTAWHGLLPIPIILRDVAAWLEATQPDERRSALFSAYLQSWLAQLGLEDLHDLLLHQLREGKALLLLDGLDEAPPLETILQPLKAMIEELPTAYPGPMLVTCRVLSYQDPRWRLRDGRWPSFELAHLTDEQIDWFTSAWYQQLAANKQVRNAADLTTRLQRAIRRPDLRPLAGNPLLLTVMAIVQTTKGVLPDARALLYDDIVELLLWRWEAIKLEKPDGEATDWHALLSAAVLSDIDVKQKLWELAFTVHTLGQSGDATANATADISEADLLETLRHLHPEKSLDWADDMVKIMKHRAGLLIESRLKVYRFPHRTFQEHLAACHLSTRPNFTEAALELAQAGAYWREVLLLAVGRLVHSGNIEPPLFFIGELCPNSATAIEPDDAVAWRNVWLAGECLVEVGLIRAGRHRTGKELTERVRHQLTALITEERLSPRERAGAGSTLSSIGDERNLEEMVLVPAGSFLMGTKPEQVEPQVAITFDWYKRNAPNSTVTEDDFRRWIQSELPQYEVTLPAFRISKYPVTNHQYAQFVAATGHRPPQHWRSDTPPPELLNHPVVYVDWHDANAYCAWVSKQRGAIVRLPTEAEWEKAARGSDGRAYPWGNEFDADRCNMFETRIQSTSTVGIFPSGNSPYGVADMAGNVWEWTSSQYRDYPYQPDDGREEPTSDARRTLRGGAFYDYEVNVRCAFRYFSYPTSWFDFVGFRVLSPGF